MMEMRRFIVIVMGKRNRSVLVLREKVKFGLELLYQAMIRT